MIEHVSRPETTRIVIDRVPETHRVGGSTLRRLYPWRLRTRSAQTDLIVSSYVTYHRTWLEALIAGRARTDADAGYRPQGWYQTSEFAEFGHSAVSYWLGWACMHCNEVTYHPGALGHHGHENRSSHLRVLGVENRTESAHQREQADRLLGRGIPGGRIERTRARIQALADDALLGRPSWSDNGDREFGFDD